MSYVEIDSETLKKALGPALGIYEKSSNFASYKNINLRKHDANHLFIEINNSFMGLQILCEAEFNNIDEFDICLDARLLSNLVKTFDKSKINLKLDSKNKLIFSVGSSNYDIRLFPKSEFIGFPEMKSERKFVIDTQNFEDGIERTFYAINEDSTAIYQGVFVKVVDDRAHFASTDLNRLSFISLPYNMTDSSPADELEPFMMPKRSVLELRKILDQIDKGEVLIHLSDDKIFIDDEKIKFFSKLLSPKFPDYKEHLKLEPVTKVLINREELLTIVRRVRIFHENKNPYLIFNFSDSKTDIKSSNQHVGEAKEEIFCEKTGPDLDITLSLDHIQDFLESDHGEKVIFEFNESSSLVHLKSQVEESFINVTVPWTLESEE